VLNADVHQISEKRWIAGVPQTERDDRYLSRCASRQHEPTCSHPGRARQRKIGMTGDCCGELMAEPNICGDDDSPNTGHFGQRF
jgi:hypothetical protein